MRRKIISERTLNELKNGLINRELAGVPYLRFVRPIKEGFSILELFRDISGKETKRKEYTTTEKPNSKAEITIIDDV